MRKNFGSKPWVYPQPVCLIGTYDENGKPDAMNAAWGGQYDHDKIMLCISNHKTTENIKVKKAFTVSFADVKNTIPADYVGIVSQNKDPDKMTKTGWHDIKSETVDAPLFAELPFTLECTLEKINEDGITVGKIVNVSVDENIIDEQGNPQFDAIIFDPMTSSYRQVGDIVGKAFSDGRKIS